MNVFPVFQRSEIRRLCETRRNSYGCTIVKSTIKPWCIFALLIKIPFFIHLTIKGKGTRFASYYSVLRNQKFVRIDYIILIIANEDAVLCLCTELLKVKNFVDDLFVGDNNIPILHSLCSSLYCFYRKSHRCFSSRFSGTFSHCWRWWRVVRHSIDGRFWK